jgi:two-component system chemotaxis sensor kinase CheA
MLELTLDQMPKRFSVAERTYDVLYTPVGSAEKLEKLLVIFNDVTEQLARERAEREQKELMAIFQRILIDRTGVEEFLAEAKKLVTSLETEEEPVVQWRVVHTLKGNSAMYGLGSLAELAHQIETQMAESDARLNDAQRAELSRAWQDAISRVQELLGGLRKDRLEVERRELFAVMERVRAGTPVNELLRELETWLDDPVERRLEQLGRQASSLARRLGKTEPEVIIQAGGVRVGGPEWSSYWSAMVHAVRNAVDHGLEPAAARSAAGKSAAGRITLGARRSANELVIWLEDDGRGIDWDKVRVAAARSARPNKTHEDLVDALFTDGFTMRQQVSEISGRGVGLAALRQAVHELHGAIAVESTLGHGTIFRFTFDESRFARQRVA